MRLRLRFCVALQPCLYGGNASGGVINVISEHFNPNFSDEINVHGQFAIVAMVINVSGILAFHYLYQTTLSFELIMLVNAAMTLISMASKVIDQTAGDKGTLENSGIDTNSFSVTGLYSQDWGFAALGYSRWKTSYGLPPSLQVLVKKSKHISERIMIV